MLLTKLWKFALPTITCCRRWLPVLWANGEAACQKRYKGVDTLV